VAFVVTVLVASLSHPLFKRVVRKLPERLKDFGELEEVSRG